MLICPGTYVGGSTPFLARRDWPIENWLKLVELLNEAKLPTRILIPSELLSSYVTFADQIVSAHTIADLVPIIRKANLVVTQDSGYMHIARYVNTPCIALFGPTSPQVFASKKINVVSSNLVCSPCHNGKTFTGICINNICMKTIEPFDVFNSILAMGV